MKRILETLGRGLAAAGLVSTLGYLIATNTSNIHNPPLWPYWIFLGILAAGGVLYLIAQRGESSSEQQELTQDEKLALALIMSDPQATTRGAWLYPLHGDLINRGFTEAKATAVLQALARKKVIVHVDVPGTDDVTGKANTAPAYRVTSAGAKIANTDEILKLRPSYRCLIQVTGDQNRNKRFLGGLRELDMVQAQTRFITSDDPKSSVIAMWSYAPVDESVIKAVGKASDARNIEIKQTS